MGEFAPAMFPHKQEQNMSEEVTPEQVIQILKEKGGLTDPAVKDLFNKWIEQEEEKAQTPDEQINLIIRQADVYEAAGMTKQARSALDDAREYAFRMDNDELCAELDARIAKL
jgi:hypothetical protein